MRILLARAILTRPQILIFDDIIHTMQPAMRETLLWWLYSKCQSLPQPHPAFTGGGPPTRYCSGVVRFRVTLSRITLTAPSSDSLKELRTFLSGERFPLSGD